MDSKYIRRSKTSRNYGRLPTVPGSSNWQQEVENTEPSSRFLFSRTNFGNGIGWNQDGIILSLLGPHVLNTKQRRMFITIDDIFLGGSKVSDFAPGFLKESMGLGKKPADFKKPPAFTFIGASYKSLIARGGTGGIAIWTRLEKDIRPAAYGAGQS